jgi:conjugative transposon TraN protein
MFKTIQYILLAFMVHLVHHKSFSQVPVEVASNKTSTIVFPTPISTVDRGSKDVLAQKAKSVDNVLYLKAAKVNFRETNLTVITSDGTLHVFMVRYADRPKVFTLYANEKSPATQKQIHFPVELTPLEFQSKAKAIAGLHSSHAIKKGKHFGMEMKLVGIFIEGNTMFFHLTIANHSNIPFHTDLLQFYIQDKRIPKRTASQQLYQVPIYQYGNAAVIQGKSSEDILYAIPKFTIPDAKTLVIELMEKNGGRNLDIKVKNKSILKAKPVPVN